MNRGSALIGVVAFVGFAAAGLLGAIAYMQYDKFRKEMIRLKEEAQKTEDNLRSENSRLKSEYKDLRRRYMRAADDLRKLQGERDILKKELDNKTQLIKGLEKRKEELTEKEAELRAVKMEIGFLKKDLNKKEHQISALKRRLTEQEKKLTEMRRVEGEYKKLAKRVSEQADLLAQKRSEISMLRRRIDWLQKQLSEAQSAKPEYEKLKKQIEQHLTEKEKLKKEYKKLMAERDSLREQLEVVVGKLSAKKKAEAKLARKFMEEFHILLSARGSMGPFWMRCSDGTLPGSLISLSQVLDLDPNTVAMYAEIRGTGRFGFSFNFSQTSYSVSTKLSEDINFGGTTFEGGHDVEGIFDVKWGSAAFYFSFGSLLRSGYRRLDFGVMAGVRIADYSAVLRDLNDNEEESTYIQMACPFGGLWFTYNFATDISFTTRLLGGSVKYQDYSSPHLFEGSVFVNLKLASVFYLEAGYIFIVQKFRHSDPDTGGYTRFEQTDSGPYIGLLLVF